MNQNNHGQPRRNSTSFNRHSHANNHSGRSNHVHNHQRWPNRYAKDYRDYESCFNHGLDTSSPFTSQSFFHFCLSFQGLHGRCERGQPQRLQFYEPRVPETSAAQSQQQNQSCDVRQRSIRNSRLETYFTLFRYRSFLYKHLKPQT